MRVLVSFVMVLVISGCIDAEPPAEPVAGPLAMERVGPSTLTIERAGTVLLRVPGDGPLLQTTGDSPCFTMHLPSGTRWVNGTLDWDSPQPMGLEYQGPAGRHTSWGDAPQPVEGPAHLDVEGLRGSVFVYGGPGIAGANIDWTLRVKITTPEAITVEALEIADDDC